MVQIQLKGKPEFLNKSGVFICKESDGLLLHTISTEVIFDLWKSFDSIPGEV